MKNDTPTTPDSPEWWYHVGYLAQMFGRGHELLPGLPTKTKNVHAAAIGAWDASQQHKPCYTAKETT